MSLQPSRTHRFFPATGPEGDRHLTIECAGSDISELELEARYQLEATGQALLDLGDGVFATAAPEQKMYVLAPQTEPVELAKSADL